MSDLDEFSHDIAAHVRAYLSGVHEIAAGESPETAVAGLIVQMAQVSMAGAMLGAVADIVPPDRFEEDAGPDPDTEPIRESLGRLLEGIDEYASIFDPLVPERPVHGRVSDDVADVAVELEHGLRHLDAGRSEEALWWWQFSYLSHWGAQALNAQRALLSIVAHQRLDSDEEAAAAAEVDALLRE